MRLYDIVTGILLILSIIDFALAAPVLVQEKRQARVGVVHRPKSVIPGLGKRWDEELANLGNLDELENMVENHFSTGATPSSNSAPQVENHFSTGAASSSSSAPQVENHFSTGAASSSSSAPQLVPGSRDLGWLLTKIPGTSTIIVDWDSLMRGTNTKDLPSTNVMRPPATNPSPEMAEEHMYGPRPNDHSLTDSSSDSESDTDYWNKGPPTPRSASSKEFGQVHEDQVHSPPLGVWSPTEPEHGAVPGPSGPLPEREVVPGPPPPEL